MPGVFSDQGIRVLHQNTLFAAHAASALRTAPFKADVTPVFATVYADLDIDNDYDDDTVYTDWTWTLPAPGDDKASLIRQFNFESGDEGVIFYGAVVYAVIDAVNTLIYAERFAVPFEVPAGGAPLLFQYNLHLAGGCP